NRVWSTRENVGCWNTAQSNIYDPLAGADQDDRTSIKVDFNYTLGDHDIRIGYNKEEYISSTIGRSYTGGVYYRYFESHEDSSTRINGVEMPVGTKAVRVIESTTQSAAFKTENTAMYIEDNWQATDNLMIYGGLRNETFTNYSANGKVFVEADSLIAPRLGFSWDVNGDSESKLYGTLGRYYIPIAANTNIRATRIEDSSQYYYHVDSFNPTTGEPIFNGVEGAFGERIGGGYTDHQDPDPRVIAVSDLEPMHQDELIIGYQRQLTDNWTGGAKLMYRKIQDGMDDFCGHDGFYNWAVDNNIPVANEANGWETPEGGFDLASMSGCLMVNPGNDLNLFADLNGNGEVEAISVSNDYIGLPSYDRTYKGLELTLERAFTDGWYANISYVLSKSSGNMEGYVNSTLGQEDAGATQDFDHKVFQDGSTGDLPNDRRHQFKAYGAYKLTDELTLTANFGLRSGIPLSCNGYAPTTGMLHGDGSSTYDEGNFGRYSSSTFYCATGTVDANGDPVSELTTRGDEGRSSWTYDFDAGVQYVPNFADGNLTMKLDVFNLFNLGKANEFDEVKDFARNDEQISKNFLQPTSYQTPRSMRLTLRYAF
ncbi:MAG: TonB-dependent receptor, partial [Algicola sp.]|nr:TonB-dependent receptor [Algicola sp.]